MSDFKANNSALKIQFALKLNNCIKNLEKFRTIKLGQLSTSLSFEDFKTIVIKKDVLAITKHFCDTLESFKSGLKINPRVLISAYLVRNYSQELIGPENDFHPVDNHIVHIAGNVIAQLESNNINNIWTSLKEFKFMFLDWSRMDKDRTIEKLVVSYYYRSTHINKIKSDDLVKKSQFADIKQQDNMIKELEKQKNQIVNSIEQIDRNFNIKYLEENYVQMFEQIQIGWTQLQLVIANTMKKTYLKMLTTDISNGNLLSCFALIKEIGQRLSILCPEKRRKSFESKFSDDILTGLLVEPAFTVELIKFIGFVIDFIIQVDAPVNDESNAKWKYQIAELMKADFAESFPIILIQIEEHIDQIYKLIMDLV